MSTDLHNLQHVHNLDREIVARYTDQPPRLPPELRRRIEASWHGAPVQLYALADLDHALRLTQVWVALGPGHLAVARPVDLTETWEIETVERARIQAVREAPGLSASTLTMLGRPGEPPLAVLRYSHRQRRAFENLKFVLEEALEGRSVTAPDADEEYAASVARPMRDAQALVAGRRVAVIRRLLGYLAPYRRHLTLGMGAATLITLVSLVPPYLAGYVIDRVVRPAQEGRLDVGRASAIAWLAVAAMALVYVVRQAAAVVRLRLMSVLGEWVARHDARHPRRQGIHPGGPRGGAVRRPQRRRDGRDQPPARHVDHVLAAADARSTRDHARCVGAGRAAPPGRRAGAVGGNVRLVPPVHHDGRRAHRGHPPNGAHHAACHDFGASPGLG